ncbi:uncharacterized protein [Oryza sativa Japonica Group]|uniref:Uncharacterized protein n=2 Tax=Oryza sativa subsp. japonica TaxID=39947 RepID=A0A8J8XZK2_ORYSJ|nr:uncharacterized protein LOC4350529 [Oryza sativa Japonica Group]EEE52110.1 hypothetical protein OsJ_33911 [Oryza sativa Japonica Group]BAT14064.1 Os11g0485000 [Oryza sativa Japonica Group]
MEEDDRPRIVPAGDAFEVYPHISSRRPSTVQGALLHRFYPGAIGLPECRTPALTWRDYKRSTNERMMSPADRVLKGFWYCFKCDPTDKVEADKVLEQNFKKNVPQMLFEEKKRATNKLYKKCKVPAEDVDEDGNHWPTVQALVSAKPNDFSVTEEGWHLLCEHWSTPEFRKKSLYRKRNRFAGGDTVYQCGGSRGLVATKQSLQHKKGGQQGLAAAWQHTHRMQQGNNEQLCNQRAEEAWSDFDQEGGNQIDDDEGNDFDLEEGNEIPEE